MALKSKHCNKWYIYYVILFSQRESEVQTFNGDIHNILFSIIFLKRRTKVRLSFLYAKIWFWFLILPKIFLFINKNLLTGYMFEVLRIIKEEQTEIMYITMINCYCYDVLMRSLWFIIGLLPNELHLIKHVKNKIRFEG